MSDDIQVPAHKRKRAMVTVTFTCVYCGDKVTVERYPGGKPQMFCGKPQCQQFARRVRSQRYQEKKRNGEDAR